MGGYGDCCSRLRSVVMTSVSWRSGVAVAVYWPREVFDVWSASRKSGVHFSGLEVRQFKGLGLAFRFHRNVKGSKGPPGSGG